MKQKMLTIILPYFSKKKKKKSNRHIEKKAEEPPVTGYVMWMLLGFVLSLSLPQTPGRNSCLHFSGPALLLP